MSWKSRLFSCTLTLAIDVSAVGTGPLRIELIDNQDAASVTEVVVDYTARAVRGSAVPVGTAAPDGFVLEAAWRPAGEDIWTIAEARATPYKSGSVWRWALSGVHVGERDDYAAEMEFIVLLSSRDRALRARILRSCRGRAGAGGDPSRRVRRRL